LIWKPGYRLHGSAEEILFHKNPRGGENGIDAEGRKTPSQPQTTYKKEHARRGVPRGISSNQYRMGDVATGQVYPFLIWGGFVWVGRELSKARKDFKGK